MVWVASGGEGNGGGASRSPPSHQPLPSDGRRRPRHGELLSVQHYVALEIIPCSLVVSLQVRLIYNRGEWLCLEHRTDGTPS